MKKNTTETASRVYLTTESAYGWTGRTVGFKTEADALAAVAREKARSKNK